MASAALRLFSTLLPGLLLVLIGCAPAALPTPLPSPQVRRILHPSPAPTITQSLPVLTPTIEAYPADYAALYHLARQVYGEERLIRWISIPAINVESLVVPVGWHIERGITGKERLEWDSPGPFVGWAIQSALPGEAHPILLYGHNNLYGSIFRNLYRLQVGDEILLQTKESLWTYAVEQVRIVPLDEQPALKQLQGNVLLLLSCYPPSGNSHRVLVTASPQPP